MNRSLPDAAENMEVTLERSCRPVERTLSWLHQYRKLEIREEHSVTTFLALTLLALCLIYMNLLTR